MNGKKPGQRASGRHPGASSRNRGRWATLSIALVLALFVGSMIIASIAGATNVSGFEIDADHTAVHDALYSGNNTGDDWAKGSSNNGVFALSGLAPHTAATDCYGSNVDLGDAVGPATFICDG